MKPIIGVLSRTEIVDGFSSEYVHEEIFIALKKHGGIPLVIPPMNKDDLIKALEKCDGIILPGGDSERIFDYVALKYAIDKNIPILGICLGMQVMATYKNNDYLDNNDSDINHNDKNKRYVHEVILNKNSKLWDILNKEKINVNSRHTFHIISPGLYKCFGKSNDGLMEVIEYQSNNFNIGVQWHPESMIDYDENSNKLFEKFIDICKNN